jgi:hypothetical protein
MIGRLVVLVFCVLVTAACARPLWPNYLCTQAVMKPEGGEWEPVIRCQPIDPSRLHEVPADPKPKDTT